MILDRARIVTEERTIPPLAVLVVPLLDGRERVFVRESREEAQAVLDRLKKAADRLTRAYGGG